MKWHDTPQGRLVTESISLSDQGLHAEALEKLDQAEALPGYRYAVLTHRGCVLHEAGRWKEGETALRAALALNERFVHAWNALGVLLKSREDYEEAAACYSRSAEISPTASVLTCLAGVQCAFDLDSAVVNAERALQHDPEWEEAIAVRDAALERIRERDEDGPPGSSREEEP